MWTKENRGRYDRSNLRYPSDLTDEEWALVASEIPPAKRGGNKRTVDIREVVNGLMYVLSSTLRILGRVRLGRSDAGPEDSFVSNDGEGLVKWQDSPSEGAGWRPAFFPRRPVEDLDAVVAPGWTEPGDGDAGLGVMERVPAVPPFGAHGPPREAVALDALDYIVIGHWAS